MQYLLTEGEYRDLVPRKRVDDLIIKVEELNKKVMELSNHPCGRSINTRSFTFYCDECPIGSLGTGTCLKPQQYSK